MTRAVVPLLVRAGVSSISVGVNGGSSSPHLPGYSLSRLSQLSTPFVWRDPASNTSVLGHWHPGGYGRMNPESREVSGLWAVNRGSTVDSVYVSGLLIEVVEVVLWIQCMAW
jgi:hypothetical protein